MLWLIWREPGTPVDSHLWLWDFLRPWLYLWAPLIYPPPWSHVYCIAKEEETGANVSDHTRNLDKWLGTTKYQLSDKVGNYSLNPWRKHIAAEELWYFLSFSPQTTSPVLMPTLTLIGKLSSSSSLNLSNQFRGILSGDGDDNRPNTARGFDHVEGAMHSSHRVVLQRFGEVGNTHILVTWGGVSIPWLGLLQKTD